MAHVRSCCLGLGAKREGQHSGMSGLIVHEWVETHGGAEKVLDAMVETLPGSDVYCLWNDDPDRLSGVHVQESWMARTPFRGRKALALPIMPTTWRHTPARTGDYEWVLASSHAFAHHVRVAEDVPKLAYVYTPARYLWEPDLDPRGSHPLARLVAPALRRLDRRRATESISVAAISEFIKHRIQKYWEIEAQVLYPPVDVTHIQSHRWEDLLNAEEQEWLSALPETFLLGASRFVRYKQLDAVIRLGEQAGLPVVLLGGGPDLSRLAALGSEASVPVMIRENPSNELLRATYGRALAFAFLPVEDFGIMPVEAMALGTPVIANRIGGAAETVVDGKSGVLIDTRSPDSWKDALDRAASLDPAEVRSASTRFDSGHFKSGLQAWVRSSVEMASPVPSRTAP